MKPEQQNKIIAEYCGWQEATSECWFGMWYQEGKHSYRYTTPNYCNDLNAMCDAEQILFEDPKDYERRYVVAVSSVISKEGDEYKESIPYDLEDIFHCLHATSAQRAEAFLRTIGKWENEQ